MGENIIKRIKFLITILVVILFVWFLILSPLISFKGYENQMREAAEKYYLINKNALPTGERMKTLTLQDLYYKAFIKEDFYIPYTKSPCSLKESWVKVRREDNEYKYYVYLKCGALQSMVDHKGPKIVLKGEEHITVGRNEKYNDPGIEKVTDNKDGKLDVKDVVIKSNVDTSKVGDYEVKYIALDNLKNKTEITRKVTVVQKLTGIVKKDTNNLGYYTGQNPNNYIRFSNMLFRIVGLDGNNVTLVADQDVSNVDYNGINEWLNYYYKHLHKNSKKYMVKAKYCNMTLTDTTLDTTECSSYTKEQYAYIPSVIDVNRAEQNNGNYLKPGTMSWVANSKDAKTAYLTREIFFGYENLSFMSYSKTDAYGVRPKITIKGNTEIKAGTGTSEDPYKIDEVPKGNGGDYLNTRTSGEYIKYSGMLWRIIEVDKDGTTKVIAEDTLRDNEELVTYIYEPSEKITYNPKQKDNVAYLINNRATEFVNTKYFVNHEIEVPIYKGKIEYNKEVDTKKYKVKLSAPNMHDMFAAMPQNQSIQRYWILNSPQQKYGTGVITDIGVPVNEEIQAYSRNGVRPVGYLDKNILITSGQGTKESPFVIAK